MRFQKIMQETSLKQNKVNVMGFYVFTRNLLFIFVFIIMFFIVID